MVKKTIPNEPKNPIRSGPIEGSIESALYYSIGCLETNPDHDSSIGKRRERVDRERRALLQWAKENGKLKSELPQEDVRGGEHIVYFDQPRQRVLKATLPNANFGFGIAYGSKTPGATPCEYLDRLRTHNRIFSDQVALEHIVPMAPGELSIVTSQPFIRGNDPTQREIDAMIIKKGFEKLGEGMFYHSGEGVLIHDLFPRNAKTDSDGFIHAIDPVIQRVTPAFADYFRRNPVTPIRA
jgi:hypothetical protein